MRFRTKTSLCSSPLGCSFLPCVVSAAQCPSGQKVLYKVLSSQSGITLQFGACPHLSVPMLCSLLFSKVQNNIARISPVTSSSRCIGLQFSYILSSAIEYAALSLFCWGIKIWKIHLSKLSSSPACYAVCWHHSRMKCSGCWLLPLMKCDCLHQSWPSHMQPTLHCTFCCFSPWLTMVDFLY